LAVKAERLGLDADPAVRARVRTATDRVLEQALLEQDASSAVSAEALAAAYDRLFQGRTQVDSRHVELMLLPNRTDADKVCASLQAGVAFGDLARRFSLDRSAPVGGDIGFLRRDQLPDTVADDAFAAADGAVVTAPSAAGRGWYLVRVDAHGSEPTPDFATVKSTLRAELLRQAASQAVLRAQAEAVIHKFNMDGSPISATQP
jgi:parvulin-like peptidyl-prolyl isomerase